MKHMKRILVLGGAGYIGSHTVYELIKAGESVLIADNLSTGHREAVHPDATFYEGDIRDRAGDPSTLIASSNKAKSILGWKPQFDDLETIISTAWNWHKNHPHGYAK